ncbi:hypothetical protein T231_07575 [Tannerella sp. oral taxon BU063 isolate Cell 6/7/9]|uniref:Uncharacterized protein n=1 Tax=Tannerella sp. oral taxon BU063 isolate Cell 6/7/9 TaxID=1411021 RepID=W2CS03_9BACT|nr:hypothetical protein T231_07575 [Tannerella sp. oral taxon BU063 isolate Cell 6/7/9]
MAGVPDALIFFCFFSSIKGRKEEQEKKSHQDKNRSGLPIIQIEIEFDYHT